MCAKAYKFVSTEDDTIQTKILNKPFNSDWLIIKSDGQMTVKGSHEDGFAWDGCTPKINFLQFTFGTPDGMMVLTTGKPITYYASMFHDAINQYKKTVDVTRKQTDKLFRNNLKEAGFIWWWLYYFAVRTFGWIKGRWKVR